MTEERSGLLLSWRHTGFSVHNSVRVEPEDWFGLHSLVVRSITKSEDS
jgi:hypothetical protein